MAGPYGLGSMLSGKSIGAPTGAQLGFLGQDEEESHIVKDVDIIQGRRDKAFERAQNLTPVEATIPEYQAANVRDAMLNVGNDLNDPNVDKGEAWWKKALGALEPLKYLDIPAELLLEAAIDPISMITGEASSGASTKLSFARGSADRKQFEAWGALFGSEDVAEGEGWWDELKGRANVAARAFEKRPLKMQLATGIAQALATGGASAVAKGVAMSASASSKAVLASKALRIGAAIIDPYEIPFRAVGMARKAMKGTVTTVAKAPNPSGASVVHTDEIVEKGKASALEVREATTYDDLRELIDSKDIFKHSRENPRYDVTGGVNNVRMEGWIRNDTIIQRVLEKGGIKDNAMLHPILERGNEIRNFIQDRLAAGTKALDDGNLETAITEFGDMAAIQLQLNTAGRPWEIGRITGKQLFGKGGFLETGMIGLKTKQGLSRTVVPVDAAEALTSVRMFKEALRRGGKLDAVMDDSVFRLGSAKGDNATNIMQNILNRHKGAYPDFDDVEAYDLRRQKATEMFLEGWEPIDIQNLLGHASPDVTKNYIKATVFMGRDEYASKVINQIEAGDFREALTGEELAKFDDAVEVVVKSIQDNKKAGAKATNLAKGYSKNDAEIARLSVLEGEKYMNTPAGQATVLGWAKQSGLNNALSSLLNGDEVLDATVHTLATQIYQLQGLREMAMLVKRGYDAVDFQRGAISKSSQFQNMVNDATIVGFNLSNNPSMLQRAGFATMPVSEGGGLEWLAVFKDKANPAKAAEISKHWEEKFQKFAVESGLGKVFGTDLASHKVRTNWKNWAEEMVAEQKTMSTMLEGANVKHGGKNYVKHNLLLNYVDLKAWELYRDWIGLEGVNKGVFGKNIEDLPHLEVAKLAIQRQIDELRFNPVGAMAKDSAVKKSYYAGYGAGKKQFVKKAKASNALDGATKEGGVFFKNGNPVLAWGDAQLESLRTWLAEPDVKALFVASRINHDSSVTAIKNAIKLIARNNPSMLGDGFTRFLTKETTGQSKIAEKWVDALANRIANNRQLWEGINNVSRYNYDDLSQRLKSLDPGRKRIDFVPDTVNGVGSELVAGVLLTLKNMVAKINSPDQLKFFHKDTLLGKTVRNIGGPVTAALWGGSIRMARPIVKAIGARARLYHDAGRQGTIVTMHTQQVAEDVLGLKADAANLAMQQAGISQGQEFFTKLQVRTADEIRLFEEGTEALRKYKTNGTTFRKLQGVTREGTAGTERVLTDSQSLRYLTQVDVVMERINPEDWDKYFVLSTKQKETMAHLKDILFQVDEQARMRGVDIVGTILDKGGEYLINYMPRLYRQGKKWGTASRNNAKRGNEGVVNSYADFFEPRVQKDILDVLAQGMEAGVSTNMSRLSSTVLESYSARMGQYVETMWKTAIDTETADYLVNSPQMKKALGGKYADEVSDLNNLERVLNERIATEGDIDGLRIAQLAKSDIVLEGMSINTLAESLAKEGTDSIANARKIRNGIMEKVIRRREEITKNWGNTAGKELNGVDWLPSSINSLDVADQRALAEHLEVVAGLATPIAKFATIMRTPTRYMRYFKASMDFGAPLIHGFNALIRLPSPTKLAKGDVKGALVAQNAWIKSVGMMGKFFFMPDTYRDYITNPDNMRIMHEAKDFIRLGHAEPLVGMDDADLLKATRKYFTEKMEPRFGKHARFLGRFEDSFTGYLDVIRTELWKGMKPSIDDQLRKNGVTDLTINNALTREHYTDLGSVINKMTGVYDPELSLRTPFQGLIETSLLFFAPIYRRATYGIISDLGRKLATGGKQDKTGVKWRNSAQQLSGIMLAGLMMGELAEATGNTRGDFFDDTEDLQVGGNALDLTARFGKLHTHGVQLGIGTAWWTAFRMASDIVMHDPLGVGYNTTLNKQEANPAWHEHWAFKMVRQRGRSQLAPGSSMIIDVLTGRTFTGDPLRDGDENDWAATLARMGQSGVPFWLDGALSNNSLTQVGISGLAELFGLQSFEISSYDKLTQARVFALRNWDSHELVEWRGDRVKNKQSISWLMAPKTIRDNIDNENLTVKTLLIDHKEKYGNKAFGDAQLFREYNELKSAATLSSVKQMANASRMFERGEINARELTVAMNQAKFLKYETNKNLLDMPKFAPITQYFAEARLNAERSDDTAAQFIGDMLYEKWAMVVFDDKFTDLETGEYLWEARRQAEDDFWADGNNHLFKSYVDDRRNAWLRELPTIRAFENAKEALRDSGYWDIEELIWGNDDRLRGKAKDFLSKTRGVREQMKLADPEYNFIDKRVKKERELIRRTNVDIDRILITWYGNKFMHPANANLETNLMAIRTSGREVTADEGEFKVSPTGRVTSH